MPILRQEGQSRRVKIEVHGNVTVHGDVHIHEGQGFGRSLFEAAGVMIAWLAMFIVAATGLALGLGVWTIGRLGNVLVLAERVLGGSHKRLVYAPWRQLEHDNQTKTADVRGAHRALPSDVRR